MKKLLLLLVVFLISSTASFAQDVATPNPPPTPTQEREHHGRDHKKEWKKGENDTKELKKAEDKDENGEKEHRGEGRKHGHDGEGSDKEYKDGKKHNHDSREGANDNVKTDTQQALQSQDIQQVDNANVTKTDGTTEVKKEGDNSRKNKKRRKH